MATENQTPNQESENGFFNNLKGKLNEFTQKAGDAFDEIKENHCLCFSYFDRLRVTNGVNPRPPYEKCLKRNPNPGY